MPQRQLNSIYKARIFKFVMDLSSSYVGHCQIEFEIESKLTENAIKIKLVIRDSRNKPTISQSWNILVNVLILYRLTRCISTIFNRAESDSMSKQFNLIRLFKMFKTYFCLKVINKLATVTNNENIQSNIIFASIFTKLPIKAIFNLFATARLYIFGDIVYSPGFVNRK